jgi:hypothetical protein
VVMPLEGDLAQFVAQPLENWTLDLPDHVRDVSRGDHGRSQVMRTSL